MGPRDHAQRRERGGTAQEVDRTPAPRSVSRLRVAKFPPQAHGVDGAETMTSDASCWLTLPSFAKSGRLAAWACRAAPSAHPGARSEKGSPVSTMNISLPESLKDFVDAQVGQRGYGTSSEYVRDLIRKDRDRQQLRQLLLDGAATTAGAPADADYFEALRDRVRRAPRDRARA